MNMKEAIEILRKEKYAYLCISHMNAHGPATARVTYLLESVNGATGEESRMFINKKIRIDSARKIKAAAESGELADLIIRTTRSTTCVSRKVKFTVEKYDSDFGTSENTYEIGLEEAYTRIYDAENEPREDPVSYVFRIDGVRV